ncbi:hypothetical protein [Krasilnikovia sp. MM14-A1259]|uniref:hypothetical protein n=1 Tax=Krasilnikovia sp. MM14-A1259 TaxID=3373539 RepID=UPI00382695CD
MKINPGSRPVTDPDEDLAAANIREFTAAVAAHHGHPLTADRATDLDTGDGRFGYRLYGEGSNPVEILMPGAPLAVVRDDLTAQAYCLRVGDYWWWSSAVDMAAARLTATA